jgi:hypothetical protein
MVEGSPASPPMVTDAIVKAGGLALCGTRVVQPRLMCAGPVWPSCEGPAAALASSQRVLVAYASSHAVRLSDRLFVIRMDVVAGGRQSRARAESRDTRPNRE